MTLIARRLDDGTFQLRTVCAWCKGVMVEGAGPSEVASHGICESCIARFETGREQQTVEALWPLDARD